MPEVQLAPSIVFDCCVEENPTSTLPQGQFSIDLKGINVSSKEWSNCTVHLISPLGSCIVHALTFPLHTGWVALIS